MAGKLRSEAEERVHYREVIGQLLESRHELRPHVGQPKVYVRIDDPHRELKELEDIPIDRIEIIDDSIVLFIK